MKLIKIQLITIILFCIGNNRLQAQESISSTGGDTFGKGGSVSYTVGQVIYTNSANSNGSISQGVQQPYEISVINSIDEAKEISLQCIVYPNPTNNFLILKVENYDFSIAVYSLYDITGRLILSKNLDGGETNIVMSNLKAATYFLKVTESNKEIKTFKIIKK
jgi:hypothetical protein